jgi:hypothetical protein
MNRFRSGLMFSFKHVYDDLHCVYYIVYYYCSFCFLSLLHVRLLSISLVMLRVHLLSNSLVMLQLTKQFEISSEYLFIGLFV